MKKASDLYSLTRRELILLEMFNMLEKSCRRTIR